MYKYIPFEKIDKNKWNGAVHYATNGNVFGYYWYLKAVLNAWDAIIEDDYESVFPIIRQRLYKEQYNVLPFLGPYSVNYINQTRFNALLEPASQKNTSAFYPLNENTPQNLLGSIPTTSSLYWKLDSRDGYEAIYNKYDQDIKIFLSKEGLSDVKFSAGIKPEHIVQTKNDPDFLKNTYLRIMYNAMHRGIGFSNAIYENNSQKIKAVSFYLFSHNSIHELYHYSEKAEYRWVMLDLLLQNHAGKPIKIYTYDLRKDDSGLGYSKEHGQHYLNYSTFQNRIRKKFGLPY